MRLITLTLALTTTLLATGCSKKDDADARKDKVAAKTKDEPAAADPAPAKAADPAAPAAPATSDDLLAVATKAGHFKTLLRAIDAAGLAATLTGPGPITVLAPTDEAFAKLPAGDLDALLADKTRLAALLTSHVIEGTPSAEDLAARLKVDGATVVQADLPAKNGVIRAIDTVLLPPVS